MLTSVTAEINELRPLLIALTGDDSARREQVVIGRRVKRQDYVSHLFWCSQPIVAPASVEIMQKGSPF